jgi:hypothetical protein
MQTKADHDYKQFVHEAEVAVAAVKDPELKRVAFEKILDQLLHSKTGAPNPRVPAGPVKSQKMIAPHKATGKTGPRAYIEELIADEFFRQQKTLAQVKAELANRGHHIPQTSLSGPLQNLCKARQLRRQKSKANGDKPAYFYSNY